MRITEDIRLFDGPKLSAQQDGGDGVNRYIFGIVSFFLIDFLRECTQD